MHVRGGAGGWGESTGIRKRGMHFEKEEFLTLEHPSVYCCSRGL